MPFSYALDKNQYTLWNVFSYQIFIGHLREAFTVKKVDTIHRFAHGVIAFFELLPIVAALFEATIVHLYEQATPIPIRKGSLKPLPAIIPTPPPVKVKDPINKPNKVKIIDKQQPKSYGFTKLQGLAWTVSILGLMGIAYLACSNNIEPKKNPAPQKTHFPPPPFNWTLETCPKEVFTPRFDLQSLFKKLWPSCPNEVASIIKLAPTTNSSAVCPAPTNKLSTDLVRYVAPLSNSSGFCPALANNISTALAQYVLPRTQKLVKTTPKIINAAYLTFTALGALGINRLVSSKYWPMAGAAAGLLHGTLGNFLHHGSVFGNPLSNELKASCLAKISTICGPVLTDIQNNSFLRLNNNIQEFFFSSVSFLPLLIPIGVNLLTKIHKDIVIKNQACLDFIMTASPMTCSFAFSKLAIPQLSQLGINLSEQVIMKSAFVASLVPICESNQEHKWVNIAIAISSIADISYMSELAAVDYTPTEIAASVATAIAIKTIFNKGIELVKYAHNKYQESKLEIDVNSII